MDRGRQLLRQLQQDFDSGLSPRQLESFGSAGRQDVYREILRIQRGQRRLKNYVNLPRIRPFLEGLKNLDIVMRVFEDETDATKLMSSIWGPLHFLLKTSSESEQAFDNFLEEYNKIGSEFPSLSEHATLFQQSVESRICIANLYKDIIKFQGILLRLITRPSWHKVFKALWRDSENTFEALRKSLREHRRVVESQGYNIRTPASSQFDSQSQSSPVAANTPILDWKLVADSVHSYERKLDALWEQFNADEVRRRREQKRDVIKWVNASELTESIHDKQCDYRRLCPNTGTWILKKNDDVAHWMREDTPKEYILWIQGKKGAGKTVLTSLIIQECQRRISEAEDRPAESLIPPNSAVSYFYCQEGDGNNHSTALDIFKGILSQIVAKNEELIPFCSEKAENSGQQTLNTSEIAKSLLEVFFDDTPRQYIIIDGLDECKSSEIRQVAQWFNDMADRFDQRRAGKLRLLFMSRYQVDMKKALSSAGVIEIQTGDNKNDIEEYVMKRLEERESDPERRFNLDNSQMDSIRDLVTARSEGMFLYAYLAMEYLLEQQRKKELLDSVREDMLPRGLKELYEGIIEQIRTKLLAKSQRHWEMAITLLGWLVCAKRPLKWHEIQAILAFNPDNTQQVIDFDLNMMRDNITETCGSIVQVLPRNKVQLIHQTARTHVIENKFVHEKEVQADLAILCLRYLSLPCFDPSRTSLDRQDLALAGYFSFQDYAISRWSSHIETLLESGLDIFLHPSQAPNSDSALGANHYEEKLHQALKEFTAAHQEGLLHTRHPELREDLVAPFHPYAFYEQLAHIWSHIFAHQKSSYETRNKVSIASLERSLEKNRGVLEQFRPNTVATGNDRLEAYYGTRFFKCSRIMCDYFHEGFETLKEREHHHNRHERPFQCPVEGCHQAPFGFSSNKDKERHVRMYHVEQSDQPSPFVQPSRRQENAKFPCSICGKSFTRNINLRGHTRSHFGERPFACSTCGKAFTRLNDCRRHEKIHTRRGG